MGRSPIRLSILICHLAGREANLSRLVDSLGPLPQEVETVIVRDEGQLRVGAKRNKLLGQARGDYVAFIDDDDLAEQGYIESILAAAEGNPDCVEMRGRIYYEGSWREFRHSLDYSGWYTGRDGIFYRTPNHLNPVKRGIALNVGFRSDLSCGEDKDYSNRILPYLKTEKKVGQILYVYNPSYGYLDHLAEGGKK